MLLSHLFLPRENYTTISLTPIFRAGTPVEQCAHTVSNEIFTPVGRNLHLSVIYYLDGGELKDKSERMTILITNDILKMIPLREEKLYELALKNMEIKFEYKFYNMIEIFEEMPIDEEEKRRLIKSCEEEIMYVLTNKEKFWGATAILRTEILEEIGKKLKQNFYIIPSSIDEGLIVPSYADIDREMMDTMIQEVNETQVSKEERLSDHAYYYSIEERKIFL